MSIYSTAEGHIVIGESAYENFIDSGGHPLDIASLGEQIVENNPCFPVENVPLKGWDKEDVHAYFCFLGGVVGRELGGDRLMPNVQQLEAAHKLGLSVSRKRLTAIAGNLARIFSELDLEPQNGKIKHIGITSSDLIEIAKRINSKYGALDKNTIKMANKEGLSPNHSVFASRFGRVSVLRALLGIDIAITNWTEDDYIDWGVVVMEANDGWLPNPDVLARFVEARYRPTSGAIRRKFGRIRKFRQLVEQEFARRQDERNVDREHWLAEYDGYSKGSAITDEDMCIDIAKIRMVGARLGIDVDRFSEATFSLRGHKLINYLSKLSTKSAAEVELCAIESGAESVIYPEIGPFVHHAWYVLPDNVRRGPRFGGDKRSRK